MKSFFVHAVTCLIPVTKWRRCARKWLLQPLGTFLFFRICQLFVKQDRYVLFDNLYEKNAECIDMYSLFTFMRSKGMKAYYCIWQENPFYEELKQNNKLENIILIKGNVFKTPEFLYATFWKLIKSKYLITSFASLRPDITTFLFRNKRLIYVMAGHGVRLLKTFILVSNYVSTQKFNRVLVSNNTEKNMLISFGWPARKLSINGLPRWDLLKRTVSEKKTIFVMFTWRTSFLPQWMAKCPYDIAKSDYFKGIYAFINDQRLQSLLGDNDITMKLALHHSMTDQIVDELPDFGNIILVPSTSISKYIGTSDLLVTDYSSVCFDFFFLDTPVIFYRPDFDDTKLCDWDIGDFENARSHDSELFNICYDSAKAVDLVEHYIKNGFVLEDENKEKTAKFFVDKNNIRERIVSRLEKGEI